ncbi:molybdate ABC transporter substrate-binding protein [Undibacterium sp. Di24W]|uniref:molybdate ABC transporter substrate-binding protein n=1 Tax=Undibacterium sp. Di24W TaxID=3413033 RepID=UPI003BF32187
MLKTSLRHFLMLALFVGTSTSTFAGDLNVSAASSLTNAFKDIAQSYQTQYPDAKVQLNFAASGTLLQQLAKGAPVDVLATADQETMDAAEKQDLILVKERKDFVRNSLVLIQPINATIKIERLEDLRQAAVKRIAIGNPASVPVGRYAQAALQAARVLPSIEGKLINTLNVRQALDYVARDEVEAGFVYATDAAIVLDKVKVAARIKVDKVITYPVAVTKDSSNQVEAKRFVQFLASPAAQVIFNKYGFQKP